MSDGKDIKAPIRLKDEQEDATSRKPRMLESVIFDIDPSKPVILDQNHGGDLVGRLALIKK